MITERHVVSLELSRRLAEAGFPQECVFGWFQTRCGKWSVGYFCGNRVKDVIAAPLLSEIMEQMPECEAICHDNREWEVGPEYSATGPDAAAALWLALRGER